MPAIITPEELQRRSAAGGPLLVDLGDEARHRQAHLPGAVHLPFAALNRAEPPASGLVPDEAALAEALGGVGIDDGVEVVAYDSEGGGRASRLLWTLDLLGHPRHALLNGGLHAWLEAEGATESGAVAPQPRDYPARLRCPEYLAERQWLLERLDDPGVVLIDARSQAEYTGEDVRAQRGGHIPGAVHLDWRALMDADGAPALRPEAQLRELLEARGVTPEHEVVVHCQTHHRSSLTYVVLRHLGFPRVRGYAGSWSEWGNDPALPVRAGEAP
ncbi:sulfurtransferase [Halorhodospira neutriphila]|uniref:Sulfurtransferase n=1 Tax=Halorhodospira neutriphila TaxID=168379 RepID=A0ABS1E1W6_9GAMM|nr:sulfurtransferase [Halorhodospira neutriphila]MBK1725781.1 thiosulfate sulfurtransferase [Halorhodospira neutriphila]